MKNLILHIQYLVRYHECVTIPGFGAFIATTLPALVDETQNIFIPPTRYISFNSEIIHNDGLIAASIARRNNISFEAASTIVKKAVEQIRRVISTYGVVEFGVIGTIKSGENGTLQFIPSEQLADKVNPYSILPQIKKPISVTQSEESKHNPRLINIGAKVMRIAASIAITISLGALIFFPVKDTAIHYVKAAIWPTYTWNDSDNNFEISQPDIQLIFSEAPSEQSNAETTVSDIKRYGVVVGVFSDVDKATAFIDGRDNLTHAPARNGLIRVYAAQTATKEECEAIVSQLRESGEWPEAWPAKL